MGLLARVRPVTCAVQVQQHAVGARPLRHRRHRRVADGEVHHDDRRADLLRELGPLVHLLHRRRGHVHVVTLDLAGPADRPADGLLRVQEPVAPAHEGLRVDVLVVLREVEAAAQRLVHHAPVVLGRQAELGLGRRADQRAPELVEVLALHHDPVRRPGERLEVVQRDPHVLETQGLERLEAEDVADDRRGQVRDRALLEEVDVVRDPRDVLARLSGHRVDAVGLRLEVLVLGQTVRPDDRPGRRGRLAGNRRRGLDRVDPVLRGDAKGAQDVGVLGLVVGVPVAHLGIRRDARCPTIPGWRCRCWRHAGHGTRTDQQRPSKDSRDQLGDRLYLVGCRSP